MRVVEVETQNRKLRYVVIDEEGKLIGPIVHYLKYLDRIGSARQTLRSYAAALRLYWEILSQEQFDWQQMTLDDLSRFVLWLKLPSGSLKGIVPRNALPSILSLDRSTCRIRHEDVSEKGSNDRLHLLGFYVMS